MPTSRKCNKTILIVDDEEKDRSTAWQILLGAGCTILQADCYRLAVTMFEANREHVDLLVADISLPDGDACDLAIRLRDRQPDLRVLFVSGHVGAEVCRFYGLDQTDIHFLKKPFTAEQLTDGVQRVLNAAEPFPRLHLKNRTA
jgi:DNA-binding NtrC family response regulator